MKKSPEESNLEERLKPSIFSGSGFLGNDERPIDEIVADDLKALEQHDIDKEDLTNLLKKAFEKVEGTFGQEVRLSENLTGEFYEAKGRIPSPFRGDGVFEKGEARIRHESSGEEIIITALSLHLISEHSFFQGKGSRYRLDPVKTYQLLKELE